MKEVFGMETPLRIEQSQRYGRPKGKNNFGMLLEVESKQSGNLTKCGDNPTLLHCIVALGRMQIRRTEEKA